MVMSRQEEKAEQLRQVTREANEVLGDMKRTVKELRRLKDEIDGLIAHEFDEKIKAQVADTLASYNETLNDAMQQGVDHVLGEFDKLEKIMLGTDKASKRAGKDSIPDLVQRKADAGGFS